MWGVSVERIRRGRSMTGTKASSSGSSPRLRNRGTRVGSSVRPRKRSTSGISFCNSSPCRCTRHPTATTALSLPSSLRSHASRIVSMDCSLADWMKPHVFTMTTSAPSTSDDTRAPCPTRAPIIRSESTVFLSHPSVTRAMRGPSALPWASTSWCTGRTLGDTPGRMGPGETGKTGRPRVRLTENDAPPNPAARRRAPRPAR